MSIRRTPRRTRADRLDRTWGTAKLVGRRMEVAGPADGENGAAAPDLAAAVAMSGPLTADDWCRLGYDLARRRARLEGLGSRLMWQVGDWLVAGEDGAYRHLNRVSVRRMAAEITGYSRHTLTMAASVARKVKPETRVDGLSWWHHLAVAKLGDSEQAAWLTRAAEREWSVRQLRERLAPAGARRVPVRRLRLVREVVKLRLADLPEAARAQLRDWWQRETAEPAR